MIKVKDLHYTYPKGESETIKGLSFNIDKGEIFGFLGPSGAGKSTTQKILTGLLTNFKGEVEIMGKDLRKHTNAYYEEIGISFEFPNIYTKLTALENLEFFASMYRDKTADPKDLLQMVGLDDVINKRTEEFSKGMRMRLNFARAFLNYPELIFLDEPTSGQDPNNARKIKDIILQKKRDGKTVFLTTHNMNVAEELCDRVAFIIDGTIPLIDSPRNLMIQNGNRLVRVEYRDNSDLKSRDFPLDNIGGNKEFLSLIKTHTIETIHSLEATLEDIFIKTTGQALDSGGKK
jgi:fluoroquinolone transport system ATP-binding protein